MDNLRMRQRVLRRLAGDERRAAKERQQQQAGLFSLGSDVSDAKRRTRDHRERERNEDIYCERRLRLALHPRQLFQQMYLSLVPRFVVHGVDDHAAEGAVARGGAEDFF